MYKKNKLPIGIESFEKIRREGFYYVDKTDLIRELLENWGEVNLFTRPRRFGKSLNINMLKYFFEYGCDSTLFDGLKVMEEPALCEKYMGKFPVISICLKDTGFTNYETARSLLCSIIGNEALRFHCLADSKRLADSEKAQYQQLITVGKGDEPGFLMSDGVLAGSLLTLCTLLRKHYGQKVILLIDEYDVPLEKAQHYGYYDEMLSLIRSMFSSALKGNGNLQFAVLTGCLKVTKESIFTGLNNLKAFSIANLRFHEHFGFSDKEVKKILEYYGLQHKFEIIKEWYDGYRFGNADIYCPWDVINYVDLLNAEPDAVPRAFWINTSSNDIIRDFIRASTIAARKDLEKLVNGEEITKKICQELTYRNLYANNNNFWSVLFITGYLTQHGWEGPDICRLAIPNLEIRQIFVEQIMEWFQEQARKDTPKLDAFCAAFPRADADAIEEQFNAYLKHTISIRDINARKDRKENFYHGLLLGLLSHQEDWSVESNAESGNGYSDILIELYEESIGIVVEVKYPDGGNLERGCRAAINQIKEMGYEEKLRQDGMETIIRYGIACDRKQCRVVAE